MDPLVEFELQLKKCFEYDEEPLFGADFVECKVSSSIATFSLYSLLSENKPDFAAYDIRKAYIDSLNLRNQLTEVNALDVSDDEEIAAIFDHHSLITSQLPEAFDEPLKSADEIIKEIDFLMSTNDPKVLDSNAQISDGNDLYYEMNLLSEEDLQQFDVNQLSALLEELEFCVREHSAVLVQELAYREELDFEQEQKDLFIARLNELHRCLDRRHFRRSSVPSVANRCFDDTKGTAKTTIQSAQGHFQNTGLPVKWSLDAPVKGKTPVLTKAHVAANAAAAVASSATSLLRRHWRRWSRGTSQSQAAGRLPRSMGQKSTPLAAIRGLLGRGRPTVSARSSPTASESEIPAALTHSASGHLIGLDEDEVNDLEYKTLTTTIPYHRSADNAGPPVDQLQVFNDLLLAILTGSPTLTGMLTDYILNVYAPADNRLCKLPI